MAYKFNGTTAIIVGDATVKILQVTHNSGGTAIDVTHAGSMHKEYESGFDDDEISFECLGAGDIVRGSMGTTSITWADGITRTLTNTVVTGVVASGSIDNRIVHTVTIRRTPA